MARNKYYEKCEENIIHECASSIIRPLLNQYYCSIMKFISYATVVTMKTNDFVNFSKYLKNSKKPCMKCDCNNKCANTKETLKTREENLRLQYNNIKTTLGKLAQVYNTTGNDYAKINKGEVRSYS